MQDTRPAACGHQASNHRLYDGLGEVERLVRAIVAYGAFDKTDVRTMRQHEGIERKETAGRPHRPETGLDLDMRMPEVFNELFVQARAVAVPLSRYAVADIANMADAAGKFVAEFVRKPGSRRVNHDATSPQL